MYKDVKILSIITARAGSKRLPGKNIKLLKGKPLIAYSIESAKKSKYLDRIIVSTEGEEIAEVAKNFGAEVPFLRPKTLAQDNTPHPPVLEHAVRHMEEKENFFPGLIVLIQPTNPFLVPEDIDRAIEKITALGANSCVPLSPVSERPEHMFYLVEEKLMPLLKRGSRETTDQKLPLLYRLNGSVFVTRRDTLMKEGKIIDEKNLCCIVMPRERSVDINDHIDFRIAEKFFEEFSSHYE